MLRIIASQFCLTFLLGGQSAGPLRNHRAWECNRRYREWRKVRDLGREFGRESSARVFPAYQTYLSNPSLTAALSVFGRVSGGLDSFGNPIVAEALTNRLSFYYPTVEYTTSAGGVAGRQSGNSSNYFGRFAPTMLGSIFAFPNSSFGNQTASFSGLPIFTRLGGVQVLVGGARAVCLAWADQLPGPWATPTVRTGRISSSAHPRVKFWRVGCSEWTRASPGLLNCRRLRLGTTPRFESGRQR